MIPRISAPEVSIDVLADRARWLRQEVFEMVMRQRDGHVPSSFSIAEILVTLVLQGCTAVDTRQPARSAAGPTDRQ